jgi:hypothetical protein
MNDGSGRALMAGVVDYAGLFPPAALPMASALEEYARAHAGPDAWMLSRFVVPAARLPEFAAARLARGEAGPVWALSAIVRDVSEDDRAAIASFNAAAGAHCARVDTVECKPATVQGIDWLVGAFASTCDVYVEVPAGGDATPWLEHLRVRGLKAKVRTGGLTPDAFPLPADLLSFIESAVRLGVPFKATAGLHHAVRGAYRLTYDAASPHAAMYGYLNVLLATAAVRAGLPRTAADALLREADATSLTFEDGTISWAGVDIPVASVDVLRRDHLVSFGSCSFLEPAAEFHALTA